MQETLVSTHIGITWICYVTLRDMLISIKKATSARVLLGIQEVFTKKTMSARDLIRAKVGFTKLSLRET